MAGDSQAPPAMARTQGERGGWSSRVRLQTARPPRPMLSVAAGL